MTKKPICHALGLLLVVGFAQACASDDDGSGENTYPPGGNTGDDGADGTDADGGDDGTGPDDGNDGTGSGGPDGGDTDSGGPGSDSGGPDTGASEPPPGFDRSAPNLLDKDGLCGYPSEGDAGYGGELGQRLQNLVLHDCDGNESELGELLCERENGRWRHAFMFTIMASWCPNCGSEAGAIAGLQSALDDADVGIIQIMIENASGGSPSSADCYAWPNSYGLVEPPVFMLTDPDTKFWAQVNGGESIPMPYNIFTDANLTVKAVDEGWQGTDHLINTLNWILENGP